MITVACVYWGTKFSKDYVYNLKAMVERNTTVPHKFVCYSDKGIPGVETRILKPGYEGWWNKLQLFDPANKVSDRVVYLDLDTVITGNIDWLLNDRSWFMGIEDLGSVNHWQQHLKDKLQTGVMSWDFDPNSHIWQTFVLSQERVINQFRGDGEYLSTIINPYHSRISIKCIRGPLRRMFLLFVFMADLALNRLCLMKSKQRWLHMHLRNGLRIIGDSNESCCSCYWQWG